MLWLEDGDVAVAGGFNFEALDVAVRGVNEQLSHPEQVKRWIVAAHPLSLKDGELTPNLKVRRSIVAQTRADLVDALYDGWSAAAVGAAAEGPEADDVLHRGEAS